MMADGLHSCMVQTYSRSRSGGRGLTGFTITRCIGCSSSTTALDRRSASERHPKH